VHDLDASTSVGEWSYENAERANALVLLRAKQTCPLSSGWQAIFK
jgi:hypothetical protein